MSRWIPALAFSVSTALTLLTAAASAADVRYFNEGQIPDPADVASLLAAPRVLSGGANGGKTRAVRMMDAAAAPQRTESVPSAQLRELSLDAPARVAKVPSVGAIALALRFSFDSTQVHAMNRAQLDAVAEGIKQLPETAIVTIAGHTDAFGSPAYNFDLSLKRAFAVRAYLAQVHGIPAKRLVAMGKGKSVPLNRANPYAPENRRVQIHAEYDVAEAEPASGAVLLVGRSGRSQ